MLALSYRMEVAPGSLRALHSLMQLRYLALHNGRMAADVTDNNLAALVRSLPDLDALILHTYSGHVLSLTVLRDIGLAGRNLRYISYQG
jgi:hypothetical protein